MKNRLARALRLRSGEGRLVLVLSFLLLANAIAGEISGIVSLSNFLDTSESVNGILLVWAADMLLMLLMTGLQSLFIDRFDRLTLMRWMALIFMGAFIVLRLLMVFGAPEWLTYSMLYLLSTQQLLIFPLFFWILANDLFDMAQTKRLFPGIAGVGWVGSLLGIGFAAIQPHFFARADVGNEEVLAFSALIYFVAYIILNTGFSDVQLRETVHTTETVRETLTEGWGFVKDVPAFRYLAMALLSLAICDVIVEFRFLAVSDFAFPAPAQYQTFYSIYRLSYTVAALLIQTFVSGRLIDKLGIQHTFLIFPSTVLVGALWMLGWPGIVSAVGGLVLVKLPEYTVDESARKAFQALVPEERRGRVSVFLDSYLYVGGSLLGIGVLGLLLVLGNVVPTVDNFYIYLTLVVAAALFALWSIVQLRKVYEESLWNWRLKRRQRRVSSVLDKLEF